MRKPVKLKAADRKIVVQSRTEELVKLIQEAFDSGDGKAHLRWTMELQGLKSK